MAALDPLYAMIRRFEGFRSKPYLCPAGVATIGYGSTGPDITLKHPPVTREWAEDRMVKQATEYALAAIRISPVLAKHPAALCAIADFTYNLGVTRYKASTLRRKVDAEDWDAAEEQIVRWVYAGGKRLPGLVLRRAAEAALLQTC